MLGTVLEWQ